ncbi:MAG: sulfotransferase [Pleurocapsa sp.]
MTLPNFLIVGAAKSGTTSLCKYLEQHPQIFISPDKEPNFFAFEGLTLPPFSGPADTNKLYKTLYQYSVTDINSYQNLFQQVSQEQAIGEGSVRYLYFPQTAERIKKYIPDVRLIVILRNPIDRLYSHYLMMRERYQLEPLGLMQALEQEDERIHNNWGWDWHYVKVGMYYQQLKRYIDLFDRKSIKVFLYEDFCQNPVQVVQEVCRHIGVDDKFVPDISKRSKVATYISKSYKLNGLLNQPNPMRSTLRCLLPQSIYKRVISYGNYLNRTPVVPMASDIRKHLQEIFKEDILQLQDSISRDLSAWI